MDTIVCALEEDWLVADSTLSSYQVHVFNPEWSTEPSLQHRMEWYAGNVFQPRSIHSAKSLRATIAFSYTLQFLVIALFFLGGDFTKQVNIHIGGVLHAMRALCTQFVDDQSSGCLF